VLHHLTLLRRYNIASVTGVRIIGVLGGVIWGGYMLTDYAGSYAACYMGDTYRRSIRGVL